MWMIETPETTFNYFNNSYRIKEMKVIPVYTRTTNFKIVQGQLLDEIASRQDVYGDGKESDSYKIFEANAAALVDEKFDLTNIKSLKIPV